MFLNVHDLLHMKKSPVQYFFMSLEAAFNKYVFKISVNGKR